MTVDVEYALREDVSIAYQAIGDGPVDIIFGAGLVSHLDLSRLSRLALRMVSRRPGSKTA